MNEIGYYRSKHPACRDSKCLVVHQHHNPLTGTESYVFGKDPVSPEGDGEAIVQAGKIFNKPCMKCAEVSRATAIREGRVISCYPRLNSNDVLETDPLDAAAKGARPAFSEPAVGSFH